MFSEYTSLILRYTYEVMKDEGKPPKGSGQRDRGET